jgi:GNAT superfamily N-acetyltransferase
MSISEEMQIIELTSDDVEAGLMLSAEAGWNQITDDWRLFVEAGRTVGFRDPSGILIATAAALPYEGPFGYVSMVLVTTSWRRRGLATRLVDRCVDVLQNLELTPVLDATPAGQEVYSRQGFIPLFGLDRWEALLQLAPAVAVQETEAEADLPDVAHLVDLDAEAMGARRPLLIRNFANRRDTRTIMKETGDGFAMIRRGRQAFQLGPLVASSESAALELLETTLDPVNGAVFLDVPIVWERVGDWLRNRGFKIQRSFMRMAFGRAQPFGKPDRLFAAAGPEFG